MTISIPISERARKYGYVIWPKKLDSQIQELLSGRETVDVVFQNTDVGQRRIGWKYHRISIGPSHTRGLDPKIRNFELTSPRDGRLEVTCR